MRLLLRRIIVPLVLALLPLWTACGGSDGSGGGGNGTDPTPSISITVTPGSLTLEQGQAGTLAVTLTRSGGFTGSVTLSVEGLPSGVTATAGSIAAGASQAQVDLSAAAAAALGNATVTIRAAASGVTAATATVSLTVEAMPVGTFQLSLDPATLSIEQGDGASSTVAIDRSGGFAGTVNLAVSGAPSGLVAALASAAVDGDETTLQVDADGALGTGTYTLTVTGTGEGTSAVTADLQVTVTEASGGGPTQATWTFCAELPLWFAVQDGPAGDWMRVSATPGTAGREFDLDVDSDRVGVAFVMDQGFGGTSLDVHYLGSDELPVVGQSFCEEAGPKTVNVVVQNLGLSQIASLVLGSSLASVFGPVPTGTFQQVPEGVLDLFGARADVDPGTGAQAIDRYYLERGLEPADGSTVTVDFLGGNSFDPVAATATIGNLGADPASMSVGFVTPTTANFLGVASFGGVTNDATRTVPLVPEARQLAGDLHTVFVNAVDDPNDLEFLRTAITFFEGVEDPTVDLGPRVQGLALSTGSAAPYARPRVQYPIQSAYDRVWSTSFDQTGRTVELFVTDGWQSGSDLDVTFPDLSGADGWNPSWALQLGAATDVTFVAMGWSVPGGTLIPVPFVDGMTLVSGSWVGPFIP